MLIQEQNAQTRRVDLFFELGNHVVEGVGKLTALNLQTIRAALADTFDLAQKSLSVKEPQEWFALESVVAPMTDKAQTYNCQLYDIMLAMQAGFARAGQAQCEAYVRQMKSVVEDVSKNAPAGSEATMTALDQVIIAISALYETLQQTGQQAVEVTRSNLDLIAAAASKSGRRASDPQTQAAKR